ncbi:MAG: YtxH domain-containing protein [Nitrospirales bacterium]|nr:YtxH domain-containing protein [Nitrospirales bacterium]
MRWIRTVEGIEEAALLNNIRRDLYRKGERLMANDRVCPLKSVGLAFVSGGLMGAAMTLLLAPMSGRQTREQLRGYARRAEENIHDLADNATRILDQAVDKGHEFINDKQSILSDAVEVARVAMQRERGRLSSEEKE